MKNSDIFEAMSGLDGKLVLDAEELRPAKAKKLHLVRRVAIGIAAVFMLAALSVGVAAAVDEDLQIFLGRSIAHNADYLDQITFDRELRTFLWEELDLDLSTRANMLIGGMKEGVFAVVLEHYNMEFPTTDKQLEHISDEIYIIRHTWHGFEIVDHAEVGEPTDQMLLLERLDTKYATVFYGRGYKTFGDADGDGARELTLARVDLSDGDFAGCLGRGTDDSKEYALTFVAIAFGDHRDAEVTDITLWEAEHGANETSYTSLYGALPEIVVNK